MIVPPFNLTKPFGSFASDLKGAGRRLRLPVLLGTVFALICTQVPLFNYLGFEFSAASAVLLSFVCGLLTVSLHHSSNSLSEAVRTSVNASLVVLFIPFAILSANALFIKNCSFLSGFIFYLLLPVPSVLFSVALALLICAANLRWRKTWFVASVIVILLQIPYVTFAEVQIYAFNPIVGYFPGFTYDETLAIEGRLLLYRLAVLAASALMLLAAGLLDRKKKNGSFRQFSRVEQGIAAILVTIVVLAIVLGHRFGFSSQEDFVRDRLGGFIETDNFEITYPAESLDEEGLISLIRLHEFYFEKLSSELRVTPRRKIKSFLYASADQKVRLIGAGRTNIAKPWLWQVHINLNDVDRSLRHELVHVLAADFGSPVLRISLNSGLIEGLAMATERTAYSESIHRLAAMAFAVNRNLDVRSLFSVTGFMRAHQGISYTMAGSFCRFLIDRYSLRRFKRLYRTGDFEGSYNKSFDDLMQEWRQFLSGFRLSQNHLTKAAYLFQRPSIFRKECARVLAALNDETRELLQQKEYRRSLQTAREALSHTNASETISLYSQALFRLGNYHELISFAQTWVRDTSLGHVLIPLRLMLGDAHWAVGNHAAAKEQYDEVLDANLSPSINEEATIRLEVLQDSKVTGQLRTVIHTMIEDSAANESLATILETHPSSRVTRYLLGRHLMARKENLRAVEMLESAGAFNLQTLEHIRQRRIALAYFRGGKYQKAKIHFWMSLNYTRNDADAIEIREWLERCDWFEKNAY